MPNEKQPIIVYNSGKRLIEALFHKETEDKKTLFFLSNEKTFSDTSNKSDINFALQWFLKKEKQILDPEKPLNIIFHFSIIHKNTDQNRSSLKEIAKKIKKNYAYIFLNSSETPPDIMICLHHVIPENNSPSTEQKIHKSIQKFHYYAEKMKSDRITEIFKHLELSKKSHKQLLREYETMYFPEKCYFLKLGPKTLFNPEELLPNDGFYNTTNTNEQN